MIALARATIAAVVATIIAFCMTGCGNKDRHVPVDASGGDNYQFEATIQVVTAMDGTRCIVMTGPGRGGIDCDWNGPKYSPLKEPK